ncbi:MAG TPA: Ig-like domain-containing protein [Solirubrobacterales bacterium]|jgi:sugar lactone lactonase YvrE
MDVTGAGQATVGGARCGVRNPWLGAALLVAALAALLAAAPAQAKPVLERIWGAPLLYEPTGAAVDAQGNVYVLNRPQEYPAVVKYRSDGTFVTRFGLSDPEYAPWNPLALAVGPSGAIYVADGHNRVVKFNAQGEFVGAWGATGSGDGQFRSPAGIAVDADENVYVTDLQNDRVQVFDASGAFIRTWGSEGSGPGQFSGPSGIAVGPDGSVFVSDSGNHRIQRFTAQGGFIQTWGTQGSGSGMLNGPCGIAVDGDGYVYVTDSRNYRVQVFSSDGAFVRAFGHDAEFTWFCGIAVDSDGFSYVTNTTETMRGRVHKFDANGTHAANWGGLQFSGLTEVELAADGTLFVLERSTHRISKVNENGRTVMTIGSQGSGPGQLSSPTGFALDAEHGLLFVADTNNHRIQKFSVDGTPLGGWGEPGSGDGQFSQPTDVAIGPDGGIYVVDSGNNRVQKFDRDGNLIGKWGGQGSGDGRFQSPQRAAVGPDGTVYVTDTGNDRVQRFTPAGKHLATWGSPGSGDGQFDQPRGVAVRDDGFVFVGDYGNGRVQVFDPNGGFVTEWGSYGFAPDQFALPNGLSLTPQGRLLVADAAEVKQIRFDRPQARIDAGPSGLTNDPRPTFEFSSDDEGASFECSLVVQGAAPQFGPCLGAKGTHTPEAPLADGTYAFSVRAVDAFGDPTPIPPHLTFTIDTVAPRTQITTAPPARTNARSARFAFTADKQGVAFECRLDDGDWEPCASSAEYEDLADGEHAFSVRATDAAGNVEAEPPTRGFVVDTVAPRTTITFGPAGPTANPRPRFEFEAEEPDADFRCSIVPAGSGPEFGPCSGPASHRPAAPLADGEWTFTVRAVDEAGNVEAEPPSRTFTVDTAAPRTTITAGPSGPTAASRPRFEFEADREDVWFECSLVARGADPDFGACSGPGASHRPTAPLADGEYTFTVRAVDELGRKDPNPPSLDFAVLATPPRITIKAGPDQGEKVPSAEVTFEFATSAPGAELECAVDDGDFAPCASPYAVSGLADGWHTVTIRATDAVGNTGELARPFRVTARACAQAEADLAKAEQRAAKARKAAKAARRKLKRLKHRGASAAKVDRAAKRASQAAKKLRAARKRLKRATAAHAEAC